MSDSARSARHPARDGAESERGYSAFRTPIGKTYSVRNRTGFAVCDSASDSAREEATRSLAGAFRSRLRLRPCEPAGGDDAEPGRCSHPSAEGLGLDFNPSASDAISPAGAEKVR